MTQEAKQEPSKFQQVLEMMDRYYQSKGWRMTWRDEMEVLCHYGTNEEWRRLFQSKTAKEMWRQFYNAYIVSEAWAKKREAAIDRVRGHCQVCHFREALQAHHLTYANIGDEPPEDLQAICVQCHKETHGRMG